MWRNRFGIAHGGDLEAFLSHIIRFRLTIVSRAVHVSLRSRISCLICSMFVHNSIIGSQSRTATSKADKIMEIEQQLALLKHGIEFGVYHASNSSSTWDRLGYFRSAPSSVKAEESILGKVRMVDHNTIRFLMLVVKFDWHRCLSFSIDFRAGCVVALAQSAIQYWFICRVWGITRMPKDTIRDM